MNVNTFLNPQVDTSVLTSLKSQCTLTAHKYEIQSSALWKNLQLEAQTLQEKQEWKAGLAQSVITFLNCGIRLPSAAGSRANYKRNLSHLKLNYLQIDLQVKYNSSHGSDHGKVVSEITPKLFNIARNSQKDYLNPFIFFSHTALRWITVCAKQKTD